MRLTTALFCTALLMVAGASGFSWDQIAGSNDYLLVGLSGCNLTTEIVVDDDSCPVFFTEMKDVREPWCDKLHMNLFYPRDPTDPPKLLIVSKRSNELTVLLEKIGYPTGKTYRLKTLQVDAGKRTLIFNFNDDLVGVVYDSDSHQLYLFGQAGQLSDQRILTCTVFGVDSDGEKIEKLYDFKVNEMFANARWSADPNNHKAYYYTKIFDNVTSTEVWEIRSIPISKLRLFLEDGISGELEKNFELEDGNNLTEDRSNVQVTNGAVYFTSDKNRKVLSLKSPETGVTCPFKMSADSPIRENFLIITGWDFCKLRDGSKADKETCVASKPIETDVPKPDEEAGFNWLMLWIILGIVAINLIIIGVIIFVVCRRRSRSAHKISFTKTVPFHPDFTSNQNQSVDF